MVFTVKSKLKNDRNDSVGSVRQQYTLVWLIYNTTSTSCIVIIMYKGQ